ncbi:hypothetical protein DTO164E3_810 [Paecilomyces variotii]|nr:hypothetical protein DTO032I3_8167 [Paecilomyces variotii]KAJ9206569.1 hypothetical protein DTO164E3_810 [Paecilomyces variotii]KAJ9275275.1 hypothetical protein DTO021D3_7813 [Paecilomyces variotii]KAJ9295031.1 hypothetical protein DTO217A2_9091 [Paecilomyces variotii]KAJ9338563.1 hypothetical protein DTO027B6_8910 [Paecilomyces variotii]
MDDKSGEMAAATSNNAPDNSDDELSEQEIRRFQDISHLSYPEAKSILIRHRANASRKRISDAHWERVKAQKEAEGFDRETYEYASQAGLIYRQDDRDNRDTNTGHSKIWLGDSADTSHWCLGSLALISIQLYANTTLKMQNIILPTLSGIFSAAHSSMLKSL